MSLGHFSAFLTPVTTLNPMIYTSTYTRARAHTEAVTGRDRKRDKESYFTCTLNSMSLSLKFDGTKLNRKRKIKI